MRKVLEYFPSMVVLLFAAFVGYTIFVWAPVYLYAEAKCLEKGYPKANVSVGLSRYCMNLDGSVTVKVDKI
jgi:hypothetical protein